MLYKALRKLNKVGGIRVLFRSVNCNIRYIVVIKYYIN